MVSQLARQTVGTADLRGSLRPEGIRAESSRALSAGVVRCPATAAAHPTLTLG